MGTAKNTDRDYDTTTDDKPYGLTGIDPKERKWKKQETLDDSRSRYGRKRYKRDWNPSPEQIKLAENMGLTGDDKYGWSQDDRYRLDVALKNAGYGDSDKVTAKNFKKMNRAIDSMKKYAADNGIEWSVDEDKLTDLLNHRGEKVGGAYHQNKNYHSWIGMDSEESARKAWDDTRQSEFGDKFWKGEQDLPTRGAEDGSPHSDDPATRAEGRSWVAGEDPGRTKITLSDLNSYMAAEYVAPGREGEWKAGQDDPRKKSEDKLDQTSYGTSAGKEAVSELQTRFIDEVYGTTDGWYDTDNPPAINDAVDNSWGLDLVRDWSDDALTAWFEDQGKDVPANEDTPIRDLLTEQQSYEWQTRGTVNWEYYRDDAAFQAAFVDQFGHEADGLDDVAGLSSVAEIRTLLPDLYGDKMKEGQGRDAWKSIWDGKYEPPPLKPPWVATELNIDEHLSEDDKAMRSKYAKGDAAEGPDREVMDAATFRQSLNIKPVEVQIPSLTFDSGREVMHGLDKNYAETGKVLETTQPKGD